MPSPYPSAFRARAVALVRAGRPISRVAAELGMSEGGLHKRVHPVIDRLVDVRLPAKVCCRVLGVSSPGYYKY